MSDLIALLDMDGTLVDYDGPMQADLNRLRHPEEPPYAAHPGGHPAYIEARMDAIKRQPGWWRGLPELALGRLIVDELRMQGFVIHVLTKGPHRTTSAWMEKVDWCREHFPDASVTITEDKGLVYGKVLVDDWPPYVQRWLEHRPRGFVIMPAQPWNEKFTHPNVLRFTGDAATRHQMVTRLAEIARLTRQVEEVST